MEGAYTTKSEGNGPERKRSNAYKHVRIRFMYLAYFLGQIFWLKIRVFVVENNKHSKNKLVMFLGMG